MLRVLPLLAITALGYYFLPQAEASYGGCGGCPAYFALIGPCVGFMCPVNGTCICDCCCMQVVALGPMAMGPPAMAGRRGYRGLGRDTAQDEIEPASACEDKLPDCLTKIKLCNDPEFKEFMTESCTRTCNRCPKRSKPPGIGGAEGTLGEENYIEGSTSLAKFYGNNRGGYGSFSDYGNGFGSSGNNWGSSGNNWGSSGNNYGSSGNDYGSSGNNWGSSGNNWGSSGNGYGRSGSGSSYGDYYR